MERIEEQGMGMNLGMDAELAHSAEASHIGTDEKLIRMANQIAGFFATQSEATRVTDTAAHIRAFWDPRMRAQLSALLARGGEGLSPLARKAAEALEAA